MEVLAEYAGNHFPICRCEKSHFKGVLLFFLELEGDWESFLQAFVISGDNHGRPIVPSKLGVTGSSFFTADKLLSGKAGDGGFCQLPPHRPGKMAAASTLRLVQNCFFASYSFVVLGIQPPLPCRSGCLGAYPSGDSLMLER